jgi:tetratricopeptide (TPR) repeat protein
VRGFRVWLPLLLVAGGILVFANGLDGPFLYDDASIVEDRDIRQLLPPWRAIGASRDSAAAGRPVVHYSLALNYAFGGLEVRGYRLLNIAVHLACGLVLFGVVRRTLERAGCPAGAGSHGMATAVALLWLVHPLQTECVNYISQRSESIMGLFCLLTLYASIRALDPGGRRWAVVAILCCALGMASKETMVVVPLIVPLYDLAYANGDWRDLLRDRGLLYGGLGASWLVLAVLMAAGPRAASVGFSLGTSAVGWAMNQCVVVLDYLRLVVWPHPLVFDYGYPQALSLAQVAPRAALLSVLVAAAVIALVRRPVIGFPAAWIFILLAPTSTIVPIITEVGAERRMYLPLAGVIVLVVVLAKSLIERVARPEIRRRVGIVVLLAVAAASAGVTASRNRDYASAVSIWRTAVDARPDNHRAHGNLGKALQQQGDMDQAIAHYRRALAIRPDYSEALNNLGSALLKLGRPDEAIEHFRSAVEANPEYTNAHYNLATVLQSERRLDEAVLHYSEALRLKPDHAKAHNNLGTALGSLGRLEQAAEQFREALRLDPDHDEARRNLALALERAATSRAGEEGR